MVDAATTNPRMIIRESKMRAFQWIAVSLCVAMTALDGFDVLSISFVGPELIDQWGIGTTQVGWMASAGLFGMAGGSLIFSPIADIVGRRNVLLLSVTIIAIGMFFSAFATNVPMLLSLRFLTGFGIGTMFAPVNSMAAEFASLKRRGIAVGLNVLGYPLGTTIGGLIATFMLAEGGFNIGPLRINFLDLNWPSVFILGAAMTAILIPLLFFFMPESMEFLLSKRPNIALPKINVIMKKLGHAPLSELPPPDEEAKMAGGLGQILKQPYLALVIVIIASYFMTISAFYFTATLTPSILVQQGFNPSLSRIGGICITVGGMLGSLTFGTLAANFKIRHLTSLVCVIAVVCTSVFGLLSFNVYALFAGAIAMGFFINAAIAGFYSGMASGFPAHLRATGSGFALGVGRFGAIVGPLVGGALSDTGLEFGWVYLIVGLPILHSALFMQLLSLDRTHALPKDDLAGGFVMLMSSAAVAGLAYYYRATWWLLALLALIAAALVVGGVYLLIRKKPSAPAAAPAAG